MEKDLVLNTGAFFEWHIKLLAAIFIVVGFAWLPINPIGGVLLVMVCVAPFGMNYFFLVNAKKKIYQDGISFFGIRFGEVKRYHAIEYLFLKQNKVTRTYNSRIQSSSISNLEFDGYIRFSEREKIHVKNDTDREVVMNVLRLLSGSLNVQIFDYTRDGSIVA